MKDIDIVELRFKQFYTCRTVRNNPLSGRFLFLLNLLSCALYSLLSFAFHKFKHLFICFEIVTFILSLKKITVLQIQ
jgi:hypothetical protein